MNYTLEDIVKIAGSDITVAGNAENKYFDKVNPLEQADAHSLVWVHPLKGNALENIQRTAAEIIICHKNVVLSDDLKREKCFVITEQPRLVFLRIVQQLFVPKIIYGKHPTASVHPEAEIHPDTFIGAFTYIGKCKIGAGSVIYGHCYLYDKVSVGKNVTIHAGTVIGADGFGYSRNEKGEAEKFPHIGGVTIEDDVEIGSNTCIDKGALGNTLIKRGAKIDNLVHIAHNVVVGENAFVIALSMIGGSTVLGDNSWIAPSAAVMNGIKVGENAVIGLGAVVLKDVPLNAKMVGNPAVNKNKAEEK
jgi:UDP-3-O-[3-hydroxymyristoyl] glucosamine N-acyltransferase